MIHRVRLSEPDIKNLASKIPPKEPEDKVLDFSRYVVNKPWGREYLMYRNNFVEIWNLFLQREQSTSMHCHPNKKTALILLSGKALFTTLNGSTELLPMDAVIIEAGVFHSTKALSEEKGIELLEIETPPAKHDLIRLKDEYGRENQAYEGLNKMEIDNGRCVRFSEVGDGPSAEKSLGDCQLCIKKIGIDRLDSDAFDYLSNWDLLIMLEGIIYGPRNDEAFGVAEILKTYELLRKKDEPQIFNVTVMGIKSGATALARPEKHLLAKFISRLK